MQTQSRLFISLFFLPIALWRGVAYDNFFSNKFIAGRSFINHTILGYLEAGHKINDTKQNLLWVEKK